MAEPNNSHVRTMGVLSRFDFDLHPPDFVLDVAVNGMFAQRTEVGVFREPLKIVVTEAKGLVQSGGGAVEFLVQRIAARQVVKHQRIARFEAGKTFINFETVLELAALGVMIAEDLKGFDVAGVPDDDSLEETDFDIQIARLFARASLGSTTTFLRHTTREILPKRRWQVKGSGPAGAIFL